MVDHTEQNAVITHPDGSWRATHAPTDAAGPGRLEAGGAPLLDACGFYIDDLSAEALLVDRFKAYRKGGAAIVESRSHFPFGAEIAVRHVARYAANHARLTCDIRWRRGAVLRRRLGLGALHLPGRWTRYYCVPPCRHLVEGAVPAWHTIPETAPGSGMIGHWHRPPQALVFERHDGWLLEVGTGFDVWRWEHNLGFGPENGSYKVMLADDGLRLVREPLMTCEEVEPRPQDYRFTWCLAWHSGEPVPGPGASTAPDSVNLIDLSDLTFPSSALRKAMPHGDAEPADPCWEASALQKPFRRAVRRLAAAGRAEGDLLVRLPMPGECWDGAHVGGRSAQPRVHTDLYALLGAAVWTRQQLGPGWRIGADWPQAPVRPSLRGLFGPNGFSAKYPDVP